MSTELIYGIHAVTALLERTPERFIEVWALKGRDDDRLQPLLNELESLGLKVQSVNRKTLDDKAEGNNHQGIMARVKEAPKLAEHDLASLLDELAAQQSQPFLLVLDGVTDPHNLGACLRSADAAGACARLPVARPKWCRSFRSPTWPAPCANCRSAASGLSAPLARPITTSIRPN
jgi:23S rRNA (guanosine2251-2'-O)-methyltransferase